MTPPKRQPAHGQMRAARAARPRRRSDAARYAAAAQLQVPVEGAGVATKQQRADAGAAQAQLDVLGRELVQGGRTAGRQLHRAHQRLAVDAVDAAVGPPAGLLALVHQPHDLLQLQRVAGLPQPQLLVERVQRLQVGADRRRDLPEELALLRRQHQLLGTQLGSQRQIAPQVGPLGHARGRIELGLLVGLALQRGDVAVELADVAHQQVHQHLDVLARAAAFDLDAARGHGAAHGHADLHGVGQDLAIRRVFDDHMAGADDAVFGARHGDRALARLQHRARRHARDADVAGGIADGAADQVAAQGHGAAARVDIAIHLAVHRDVAAVDVAQLLHVAEFLVGAGQLQIAGGAAADALGADDLVGDGNAARLGVDVEEAFARGDQEFAVGLLLDGRAVAGPVLQDDVLGLAGRQHHAGQVEAGPAGLPRLLLEQPQAALDLRETVLETEQVDPAVGALARRVVAAQVLRHLDHHGVDAGRRVELARHRDALGLAGGDGGLHGRHVDAEAHALVPQLGDEFIDVQPGQLLGDHAAVGLRRRV